LKEQKNEAFLGILKSYVAAFWSVESKCVHRERNVEMLVLGNLRDLTRLCV